MEKLTRDEVVICFSVFTEHIVINKWMSGIFPNESKDTDKIRHFLLTRMYFLATKLIRELDIVREISPQIGTGNIEEVIEFMYELIKNFDCDCTRDTNGKCI